MLQPASLQFPLLDPRVARELGIEIGAGLHTGECELVAGKATVVAGSGVDFEDRGEHDLKVIPRTWHVFGVAR